MAACILFLVILIALKIRMIFPCVAVLAAIGIGFYIKSIATRTYQKRLDCFQIGQLVTGYVSGQSRAFNPFASKRKYTITLTTEDKKVITVAHSSEELWSKFPINTQVLGLTYNGQSFFGPEMGVDFKLFLNQQFHFLNAKITS